MVTKSECKVLAKVGNDEPIFVLRAQDDLSIGAIDHWIDAAIEMGVNKEKIKSVEKALDDMHRWRRENKTKTAD